MYFRSCIKMYREQELDMRYKHVGKMKKIENVTRNFVGSGYTIELVFVGFALTQQSMFV